MILLGSSDIGALEYLSKIKNITRAKIKWITIKKYFNFLRSKKLKISKNFKSLKNIKLIITGSPLGNTLDKQMIKFGKKNKIFTIQVIEHWTNFKERFVYNKKILYPDLIFVNDRIAYNLALKAKIPKKKIKIMGNIEYEYLSNKNKNNLNLKKKTNKILFISENIKGSTIKISKEYKLNEFETIKKILENIPDNCELIIKAHPSENIKRYGIFSKYGNVKVIKNMNFQDMIKIPKKIIGIKSALLLKLSIFRSDIISFRPKKDKIFIGEKLRAVTLVRKNLKKAINSNIMIKNKLDKRFIGSSIRFKSFLKKKLIT